MSRRRYEPIPASHTMSILGRPTCYQCFRPTSHCLCGFMQPFRAHCDVLILQHPNEKRKYYSTSKILAHAIENCRIVPGIEFDQEKIARFTRGQQVHLLYPSPHACDCSEISLDSKSTIIAIDGTWREAAKIIFRNPFLKEFSAVTFKSPLQSQYRIRKQPKQGCLSTLESLAHLLTQSAGSGNYRGLLPCYEKLFDGFHHLVNQQLSYWPAREVIT